MQKGETLISMALAAAVLLGVLAIQRRWNPAALKDAAATATEYILATAVTGGQISDIPGYEKVKTFRLDSFRAGLYRVTPAPLVFTSGRLVIYNHDNQPVFQLETLEGSRDSWTTLYDFAGRHGLPVAGVRATPNYMRSLTGSSLPDVVIGQYSGGDHCCTLATIVELQKDTVRVVGQIGDLEGMPFEGMEIRRLKKDATWECIAHRPYTTSCGTRDDAADIVTVYAFENGRYTDQTPQFTDYLGDVLRENLAKWKQEKARSIQLLQTMAADYALLGQKDKGNQLFGMNLSHFLPQLQQKGVDPNACLDSLDALLDRLSGGLP